MKSKRISLTKKVQQDISFSIERHITDIRLYWLRKCVSVNSDLTHHDRDTALERLSGDLLADINSILGVGTGE